MNQRIKNLDTFRAIAAIVVLIWYIDWSRKDNCRIVDII